MPWFVLALLSALFAALVAIFAKIGLGSVNPNLVAVIRSVFVLLTLLGFGFASGNLSSFSWGLFSSKEGIFVILSGVAGAISWLFYFWALKTGSAAQVSAIDKTSLVLVVMLSAIFLAERITWQTVLGAILMVFGATLISWPH